MQIIQKKRTQEMRGITTGMIQDNFPKWKDLSLEIEAAEFPTHWIKAHHDEIF